MLHAWRMPFSLSAEQGEKAEKSTLLDRGGKFLMPAEGLAPWGSRHKADILAGIVRLRTIADINKELRRQVWNAQHPDAPKPRDGEDEPDAESKELFDESKFTGGDAVIAYGFARFVTNTHNYAPSLEGERVKQILQLLKAHGTGMAVEPKKPTLGSRIKGIFGRGKGEQET